MREVVHNEVLTLEADEMTFRDYGSKVVGEVTLDQVYGGARGIKSLVWEVRTATLNGGVCACRADWANRALCSTPRRVSASVAGL